MAQRWILDGKIALANGKTLMDPGKRLSANTRLKLIGGRPFVSRSGDKLEAFLRMYAIPVRDMRCLDIGASTGGFTDCLLRHGAAHVTCVDVGHGQLHSTIASDKRVFSMEGVNARGLQNETLPYGEYHIIVIDVSFISLRHILKPAWQRLQVGGCMIALIKPQFEAGKEATTTNRGVIKDPKQGEAAVNGITNYAGKEFSTKPLGLLASPIRGADGNQEYIAGWRRAD